MRPVLEWCGICLQDGSKVISIAVVDRVPLCKPCADMFSDVPEALEGARKFLKDFEEESEPIERYQEPYVTASPIAKPHIQRCACGCGTEIPDGQRFAKGHTVTSVPEPDKESPKRQRMAAVHAKSGAAPVVRPAKPLLCGCGKPFKHAGRCQGTKVVREGGLRVVTMAEKTSETKNGHPCRCGCGTVLFGTFAYVRGHKTKAGLAKPVGPRKQAVPLSGSKLQRELQLLIQGEEAKIAAAQETIASIKSVMRLFQNT